MDKELLFNEIIQDLVDNDLMNIHDYPDFDVMCGLAKNILRDKLSEYLIIQGNIL